MPRRRRIHFEGGDDGGMTRSRLLELRRRDPVAYRAHMTELRDAALGLVEHIRARDRERRAIKSSSRTACGVRHRRAPGARPVHRRGSRRTCAPTRAGPDDPDPPGHSRSVSPANRRAASLCPNGRPS
jgi:hypothetical protein